MEAKNKYKKIDKDIKELVLFRIKTSKLPTNIKLSIGNLSEEPLSTEDVIKHVEQEDLIGQKIVEMEMNYLRLLKKGIRSQIQNV